MEDQNAKRFSFISSLNIHSYTNTSLKSEQTPIYQSSQPPYNFYQILELKGGKRLLQFYQTIANLSQAIVDIKDFQILHVQCNIFQRLLKTQQQTRQETIRIYMNYYNFTLSDWKQLKKRRGEIVSQEEIIYIMKILLHIAAEYKRIYSQHLRVLHSKNIFITNSWKIVLYPILFPVQYNFEEIIFTQRGQKKQGDNHAKILKQISIGTYSSQSTLESSRVCQNNKQNCSDSDLTDIFLIVLQLITYKQKEYFYSQKHKMMKLDLVRQFLKSKEYIGHLQTQFLEILEQMAQGKLSSCQNLLRRLQQINKDQQEIYSLRRQPDKKLEQENEKSQEVIQNEKRKKVRTTICLSNIGTIKKCDSFY